MKDIFLVSCLGLIFSGSILMFFLVYPEERNCLNIDQVREVLEKSKQLEAQGELQSARQGYKQLDLYACNRSNEQIYATDRSMVIGTNIHEAYDVTMKLIALHHETHGYYPSDLDEIRDLIPKIYIHAFNGFRLVIKDDGTVDIVTGLYGSASFSLN